MVTNYVRGASITSSALQAEIREMLTDYGATEFRCIWEGGKAAVVFSSGERQFRFVLDLPASAQTAPDQGSAKTSEEVARRRWRQLALLIRAKLDAVASGIVTFDEEFLGYMVMPGGGTVFQAASPAITRAYAAHDVRSGDATPSARRD